MEEVTNSKRITMMSFDQAQQCINNLSLNENSLRCGQ